ncbi:MULTISPECIES: protein TolQ [Limnobacter]|uniref:Tol-Pal system protein TolQ n=1 Tax=Limnobacter litoralis TaxID=481366 RepID=A0ABQ5YUL2_9BURK|nr:MULTISPECIES: protein TolQ [Limnobacter]GLR27156.1 TolQ transport protein [Limnobacter litoralis]HEX5485011.1 protein TolQ [Limnobacter sp.]
MNISQDMSFVTLVTEASFVVQIVMLILVMVSLVSWANIFKKWVVLGRARKLSNKFEEEFWSGGDLNTLFQRASTRRNDAGPLERIFEAGMSEFLRARDKKGLTDSSLIIDGARRAMKAAYQRENDQLERNLPFLASAGSVSPYIGLFGTVWGIMHAFRGLSNVQQATLASVAPGIAEALVATAIGLFAAIPAVVAYNRFATDIDRLAIQFETFIEEFLNILQRQH